MDYKVFNIKDGDLSGYSRLYTYYFKKLYNYGRKFTSDTNIIEDSIQDIFLTFWKNKEQLSSVETLNSYLISSFRYTLFRQLKKAKKITTEQESYEPDFSVEHFIIRKEMGEELQKSFRNAIQSLTARQREAIFLRFYEGLSYDEIASIMNISVKGVYKIMARSLDALKEMLPIQLAVIFILLKYHD